MKLTSSPHNFVFNKNYINIKTSSEIFPKNIQNIHNDNLYNLYKVMS